MEKVLLAMSGGIDSSVAAYLLREKGMAVEGVFFILFDEPANIELAKQTANFLNIKLHIEDLREKFKADVITPFLKAIKKELHQIPVLYAIEK